MEKFIVDTSSFIHRLEDIQPEKTIITLHVQRELEKHKSNFKDPELQSYAREALRWIDEYEHVLEFNNNQVVSFQHLNPADFDIHYTDNRLLDLLVQENEKGRSVGLISNDRSLRQLAKGLGYYAAPYFEEPTNVIKGTRAFGQTVREYELFKQNMSSVDNFKNVLNLAVGQYAVIYSQEEQDEIDAVREADIRKYGKVTEDNRLRRPLEYMAVRYEWSELYEMYRYQEIKMGLCIQSWHMGDKDGIVRPRNLRQAIAIHSLNHNDLSIFTGPAGCGKSYLSVSKIMNHLFEKGSFEPVYLITNNVPMAESRTFGLTKGDTNSKIMQSNLGLILKTKIGVEATEELVRTGRIVLLPIEHMRGTSLSGIIYATEVQNYTRRQMRALFERTELDGKIIAEGDFDQVDTHLARGRNSGIQAALNLYHGDDYAGAVELQVNQRHPLAAKASLM